MKRAVQVALMLLLGGGAFYLVFRGVVWDEFFAELGSVRWPMFAFGILLFGGLHVSRSIRWGRLVQAFEPSVGFRSYFSICSVGFFLINVLPFRLGEIARPTLLLEREDVPFGSGAATVLVERVLDVAALGVLFVGVLVWGLDDIETIPITINEQPYDLVQVGRGLILGALVPFGGGIVALLLLGDRGVELGRRIFGLAGARFGDLVAGFLASFLTALQSLGSRRAIAQQAFWTAASWGINVCSMWVMVRAFPFGATMGFWDGATILVTICIVLILPPPPGFAGVFEGAVAIAVTQLYGESMSTAAAFGVLVHISQFALLTGLGVLFLSIDDISVRKLLDGMAEVRKGAAAESPQTG